MDVSFEIIDHILPGQHIREYPKALRTSQEAVVRIAIKQYVPRHRSTPLPENAVTIIGTHSNGFPKETFEPFMAALCQRLETKGVCVRSIWMADVTHQGASSVLNEQVLGDMPSWFDHSRDLLHMINTFRKEMPRPLIGIGHSFGCASLVHLSMTHPRLLSALVICEPIIYDDYLPAVNPAIMPVLRRDVWKSRAEAEARLRKAFGNWHPGALEAYLRHGLRALPTPIYPTQDQGGVTLTTTKHMEAFTFIQMRLQPPSEMDRLLYPDHSPAMGFDHIAERPEMRLAMRYLPFLRPDVLYVFGGKSPLSPQLEIEKKVNVTGTEVGGSGGLKAGRVHSVILPKSGHLVPFEAVDEYASICADWLEKWFKQWLADEKALRDYKSPMSDETMQRMSKDFIVAAKLSPNTPRVTLAEKLKEKL